MAIFAGFRPASEIRTKATPCVEVWQTIDIQSAAAEVRRGKKERRRRKNKQHDENIMVCSIP